MPNNVISDMVPVAAAGQPPTETVATQQAVGPVYPIIDARFCAPHQVSFKLNENFGSFSGDDFTIKDVKTGQAWFKMDSKVMSVRQRRQLLDMQGRPAISMIRKLASLHRTWFLYSDAEYSVLAGKITAQFLPLFAKGKVYLKDSDEASYRFKGDILKRNYEVYYIEQGGAERLAAKIKKESMFASGKSFVKQVCGRESYFVDVEPGFDCAAMVALAIYLDEQYREKQ